jgi:hypothetical protein
MRQAAEALEELGLSLERGRLGEMGGQIELRAGDPAAGGRPEALQVLAADGSERQSVAFADALRKGRLQDLPGVLSKHADRSDLVEVDGNRPAPAAFPVELEQLIEPTGVRLMHGPAGIRLLEYLPATGGLGRALRRLQLTSLVTAVNRLLGRIRKPLGRFFPDQRRPRRWP